MLDPKGRKDVLRIIHKLHDEGITVVLITHFMEEAAQADTVVILDNGRIAAKGTPEEVFSLKEIPKSAPLDEVSVCPVQVVVKTKSVVELGTAMHVAGVLRPVIVISARFLKNDAEEKLKVIKATKTMVLIFNYNIYSIGTYIY